MCGSRSAIGIRIQEAPEYASGTTTLEQTKKISFRIFSVLCKMAQELDLHTGSDQKVPAPTGSGSATLPPGSLYSIHLFLQTHPGGK